MFFNANALMGTKLKKFERLNKKGSLTAMSRKAWEASQQNRGIKMDEYIKDPELLKALQDPANQVPLSTPPKGDVSRPELNFMDGNASVSTPESSFMGGNQVETFKSLTSPESVDRSGRAIPSDELDPVGIKPAMNPPMATPIDIDKKGINSLYNEF
jgi:hypothetical protein